MSEDPPRDALLSALEARIGRLFTDRALLARALTHSSFAHENPGASEGDYERLEFLGDAFLGLVAADALFRDDPAASEGELTRRKQAIVSMPVLARAARRLELGSYLLLGRGEIASGGRERDALLADAFEAVLGAVYLDGGVRAGRTFVRRQLEPLRGASSVDGAKRDAKTELQERWQATLQLTPRYRIVSTFGPAHAREFEVEVVVGDDTLARGRGRSRKAAEQDAARLALEVPTRETR